MVNKQYSQRGFTLVEVLISMLVISIVLALTMPAITRQKNSDVSEKWDYGIMPYNITYSASVAERDQQDVSIGTRERNNSRLTVEGSRWRDKSLVSRTADVILQSTVSPWAVVGFLGQGIPLGAEEQEVNNFDNIGKVMFDDQFNIGIGRNVFNNLQVRNLTTNANIDTSTNNIAIGTNSLSSIRRNTSNNDQDNIAIGFNTLSRLGTEDGGITNHDDFNNIAIGNEALSFLEIGDNNYALGSGAGAGLREGSDNIFVGNNAGRTLSEGEGNIFIGANAGGAVMRINGTTGDANICTGGVDPAECGVAQGISSGNYNIFIGPNASPRGMNAVSGMIIISNGPTTSPEHNIFGTEAVANTFKTPLLLIYPDNSRSNAAGAALGANTDYYIMWTRNLFVNNITASARILYSDARMKDIKGKYERGLDEILKIKPVTYLLKDEQSDSKRHVGVIAQDLKKIIPEAVVVENSGYYGVQYQYIDMAMVNAVKELDKQEDDLDARISKLEEKLIK